MLWLILSPHSRTIEPRCTVRLFTNCWKLTKYNGATHRCREGSPHSKGIVGGVNLYRSDWLTGPE
jgi:hypothetical protein